MEKISIINRKGGVGKSTTAINLCAALALCGKKSLLIDLDDQANSTLALGYTSEMGITLYDSLTDKAMDTELQVYNFAKNFDFVASSRLLEIVENVMRDRVGAEQVLKFLVSGVEDDYDYIVFDCPPSAGLMTRSALLSSTGVIIPHDCGQFSECGIPKTTELCEEAKKFNRGLKILGFLRTKFKNTTLCKNTKETLENHYPDIPVLRTTIKECVALGKTFEEHKTIFSWTGAGTAQGRVDYRSLADEIIELCN